MGYKIHSRAHGCKKIQTHGARALGLAGFLFSYFLLLMEREQEKKANDPA